MSSASRIVPLGDGFHVWTRKVGDSPVKMLLLHGGPGCTHEYLENFAEYLPPAGVEIYFYDQLGSYYSDQPDDASLWNLERFREEVDTVRRYLGLDKFYLFGSSWGGMLSLEYALHYPEALKGLIISNMTASVDSYLKYINALRDKLPRSLLATMEKYEAAGEYEAPDYVAILQEHLYEKHICRCQPWPDAVVRTFAHMAAPVYNAMQGANEFVFTGSLKDWNRWDDLHRIETPSLLIVGRHDSMSVADIEEMGQRMPNGRVGICENGSHLSMWDDTEAYFGHLLNFVHAVEAVGD